MFCAFWEKHIDVDGQELSCLSNHHRAYSMFLLSAEGVSNYLCIDAPHIEIPGRDSVSMLH